MYIKISSKDFKRVIMNCDKVCDKKNFDYLHFKADGGFLYISVIKEEGMENITYTGKCKLVDSRDEGKVFILKFTEVKEIARLIKGKLSTFIEIMDIDEDTKFRLNADNGIMFRLDDHDIILYTYDKNFPFINDEEEKSNIEVDYGLLIKSMKVWTNLYKRKKNDVDHYKYFYIEVKEGKIRYTATNGSKLLITEVGDTEALDAVIAISYDMIKQIVRLKESDKKVKLVFTFDYLSIQGEDFEVRIRNNGRTVYNYEVLFKGLEEDGNTVINSETFKDIINSLKMVDLENYKDDRLHLEIKDKRLVSTLRITEGERCDDEEEYITQGVFDGSVEFWCMVHMIESICDAFKEEEFKVITYTVNWMFLKTKDNINVLIAGCYHGE